MHISWSYASLPKLVQIGLLYHIAAIKTIGRKSSFSRKNFLKWNFYRRVGGESKIRLTACVTKSRQKREL